ncbi:6018_t:CDS:2 [Ambispora gerdemannii]|uniref:Alpha-galactosidase n=1 Tax=Ambispora gerdemannii TaxID=144530 RepID=A0A9N9C5M0_9GLOM|nr:6018_t:CDS:2 [Ambispora gerdemannii]
MFSGMVINRIFIAFAFLVSLIYLKKCCYALDNGVGLTPSMGWNSWNKFACDIDEKLIRETADALVSTGLRDLGYKYLNLDDCWQKKRNWRGEILSDNSKFPSGMKELAKYIHERGLLFGIYSSAGYWTCQRRPGSLLREDTDAQAYADWGVDYLKYDNCYNLGVDTVKRYTWMRDALNKTGRPILYSICNWGEHDPWIWGPKVGNSWRTTGDINDVYRVDKKQDPRHCDPCGMLEILDSTVGLEEHAGPGGFNDLDMLEVGNGGMTHEEYKTHFSLWAALKSPLIIGCDVRNLTAETIAILTNKEIIAINQDPLGKSAKLVFREEHSYDVWAGKLSDEYGFQNGVAILFNRKDTPQAIKLPFSLLKPFFHKYSAVNKNITKDDSSREVMAFRLP